MLLAIILGGILLSMIWVFPITTYKKQRKGHPNPDKVEPNDIFWVVVWTPAGMGVMALWAYVIGPFVY